MTPASFARKAALPSLLLCLAAAAFAASRALAEEAGAEAVCNLGECYGIKWRTPNLAQVRALQVAAKSVEGRLPIHYATASCSPPAVFEILAEKGASFNIREPASNLSPLQIALRNCSFATIRTMLFYGADPNSFDPETGGNALHYAIAKKMSHNKIKLVAEAGVDVNQPDGRGLSPLMNAMIKDDRALIDLLLANGADPNVYDANGVGPVHYAAQKNDYVLLRQLRDLGADLGALSSRGRSPLHILAAQGVTPELVALFKIGDVDPDPVDEAGLTPLHYAAAQTSPESVAALVVLGGEVNLADDVGDTPLHYALRYNPDPLVVRALLRVGADPNLPTGTGEEPTLLAIKHGDDITAMELLVDYGAEPTTEDELGMTLLHHAVLNRNPQVAASLMSLGADPFKRDNLGRSPYDLSVRVDIGDPAREVFAAKKRERDDRIALQRDKEAKQREERRQQQQQRQELSAAREAQRIAPAYDFKNEAAGESKLKLLQRKIAETEASLRRFEEGKLERKSEDYRERVKELRQQEANVTNKLEDIRRRANERRRKKPANQ